MTRRRVRSQPSYRTLLHRSEAARGRAVPRLLAAGGIIGGAFALGLLFGDHATTNGSSALDGGLAKIDELTGEYEEVRDQLRLTFHKELTEAEKAVEASRVRREQVAAGVSDALPVLSAHDNPLAGKGPEQGAPVEARPAPASAPVEAPARKAAPATPAVAQAPAAEGPDDDEAEAPAVVAGSRKRLASALTSLFGDDTPDWAKKANKASPQKVAQAAPAKAKAAAAPPTPKATPAAPKSTPAMGTYYLQVASSPSADGADRLRGKLAADGHSAAVVEVEVGGRTMHRVVITGFADRAAADRARDTVASTHGLRGLVRAAR